MELHSGSTNPRTHDQVLVKGGTRGDLTPQGDRLIRGQVAASSEIRSSSSDVINCLKSDHS